MQNRYKEMGEKKNDDAVCRKKKEKEKHTQKRRPIHVLSFFSGKRCEINLSMSFLFSPICPPRLKAFVVAHSRIAAVIALLLLHHRLLLLLHGSVLILRKLTIYATGTAGGLVVFQQVGPRLNETVESLLHIGLVVHGTLLLLLLLLACTLVTTRSIPGRRNGHGSRTNPTASTTQPTAAGTENAENALLKFLRILSSGTTFGIEILDFL